jgi:hypothetical protein
MRGRVGAQDVGQHQRVAGVALGPANHVPVAIPRHGQRVDRKQLVARCAQRRHQQPFRRLDRDRDRLLAALGMFGQQLEQLAEARGVLGDAPLGHQYTLVVDQRDVVMTL